MGRDWTRGVLRAVVATLLSVAVFVAGVPATALAEASGEAAAAVTAATTTGAATASDGTDEAAQSVSVYVTVVGPDASGDNSAWLEDARGSVDPAGSDWDATVAALDAAGLAYDAQTSSYGIYLDTITSPTDGTAYGYDSATGRYWQLFVNGVAASAGAGSTTPHEGDSIVWFYSSYGETLDDVDLCHVSVSVVGPESSAAAASNSYWMQPSYETVAISGDAWTASEEAFDAAGLAYDAYPTQYGIYLDAITSPTDGTAYGYDSATGRYWQLFVNGVAASAGAGSTTLHEGDVVEWRYSAYGDGDAPVGGVTYDSPSTQLPDYASDWPGSGTNGNVTTSATPTTGASVDWKTLVGGGASVSEPLLVNGDVYVAVGSSFMGGASATEHADEIVRIDASTGTVEAVGDLYGDISYTSRPTYADGMVYVAFEDGTVQALNAETLLTRWVYSAGTAGGDESSCTLSVSGGLLFSATATYGSAGCTGGSVLALDATTGRLEWVARNATAGYYWTNTLQAGDYTLAADTSGTLHVLRTSDGTEVSTLPLGSAVNADLVAYDGDEVIALTRDGVLHVLRVGSDGTVALAGETSSLGAVGKGSPTVVGDTAVVGGATSDGTSALLVFVDLATMQVTNAVTTVGTATGVETIAAGSGGGVSSSVLVSVQASGTYCYFTVNDATPTDRTYTSYSSGGDLYCYRVGDASARLLYAPDGTVADFCDSQVVCDAEGDLYYLNDSGYLVRLSASAATGADAAGSGTATGEASGVVAGTSGDDLSAGETGDPAASASATAASAASGDGSVQATSAASTTVAVQGDASPTAGGSSSSAVEAQASVPAWPFVGMAVGVAAIVCALVALGRRGGGGE